MITLAAGGGDYIFLVVMLVFGLINWLTNKAKEGKAAPPPHPGRPTVRPSASAPPAADPEAERMRRFLEALGVPTDVSGEPAPPAAPTLAPVPRPAPVIPRAAPPPLPSAEYSLDEADTTSEPVEHIHLPELQTHSAPEFQTVSSRVSADPNGEFMTLAAQVSAVPTVERVADLVAEKRESIADASTILAKLRSRADVRTALVLREILGPPRSLQSW